MKLIKENENQLELRDNPWYFLILFLFFTLMGYLMAYKPYLFISPGPASFGKMFIYVGVIGALFFYSYSIILFDKKSQTLRITRFGLLGLGRKSYQLSGVKQIYYRLDGYGKIGSRVGGLLVQWGDGHEIPLSFVRKSNTVGNDREIGKKIANFLNVPYIQDEVTEKGLEFKQ